MKIGRARIAVTPYATAASTPMNVSAAGARMRSSENHATSPATASAATTVTTSNGMVRLGLSAARAAARSEGTKYGSPVRTNHTSVAWIGSSGRRRTSRHGSSPGDGRTGHGARGPRAFVDVVVHRRDEVVDGLEAQHPPEPVHENDLHLTVVEIQVTLGVDDVGLHPAAALSGEGGVHTDADGRRHRLAVLAVQDADPAGVHPVGRHGCVAAGRDVGGRETELTSALVAALDHATDGDRTAQRLRSTLDVARGQAGPDVRRGPHLGATVERKALGLEALLGADPGEQRDVTGGSLAEPEVHPHDDAGDMERVDQDRRDELFRGPVRHLAGERQHQHVVDAGVGEQRRPAGRCR